MEKAITEKLNEAPHTTPNFTTEAAVNLSEIVSFDDLDAAGSMAGAKAAGKVRR